MGLQAKLKTWLNLYQGNTERIRTKNKMKKIEMNILYKNKIFINIKIQKNLKYSAKKRQVKPNLPYSILYPLTNSDSPSTKSKGVRPSSIKHMAINKKSRKK